MCCFLPLNYFILEFPKLPFREFTALLPSFFSLCLSPLRFSLRETQKVAVRGLSSSSSTSLLCDLDQVSQPSWGTAPASVLPTLHSGGSGHVCEWAIETVGTSQMQMKSSSQHIYVLFPRPWSLTRNTCFASVVCGLDFTWAGPKQFPSPVPTSPQWCPLLHLLPQLAKDSLHYF